MISFSLYPCSPRALPRHIPPPRRADPADKDPDLRALRQVLQRQLAADPAFAPLLDDPRARAALERLAQ